MQEFAAHYGHWGVVIIMVVIASWILYRYAAPTSWRSAIPGDFPGTGGPTDPLANRAHTGALSRHRLGLCPARTPRGSPAGPHVR
jgi:hypothetical protein